MRQNRSIPDCAVIPVLAYQDLSAAVEWLGSAFGFTPRVRIGDHRVQLNTDNGGAVVARQATEDHPAASANHSVMVRVNDVDAHYARASRAGARITHPPETYAFGERQYGAIDIGGHAWTFSQTTDDVAPESWGGVTVDTGA